MIRLDAINRLRLEDEVDRTLRPYYKTLFVGLKLNHPQNVAIIHPILFVLRRIFYSACIVFLSDEDSSVMIGIFLLLITSLLMGIFVFSVAQWKDRSLNRQHFINEFFLYLLLCFLLCFCGLINSSSDSIDVGLVTIFFICVLISYNLVEILYSFAYQAKINMRRY